MLITCVSDTHELHNDLELPGGDLLIHAGDITFFSRRRSAVADFNDWLRLQPYRHKIVVPGNHDSLLDDEEYRQQISNAHLLMNSGIIIDGLKIWGAAGTHLDSGAFAVPATKARDTLWARIPSDTDILVTHVPPCGILDGAPGTEEHGGCPALRKRVEAVESRLHIFGHVHCAAGQERRGRTLFVNAALAGEYGDLDRQPITVSLNTS